MAERLEPRLSIGGNGGPALRAEPRLAMPAGAQRQANAGNLGGLPREPAYDAAGTGRRNMGWRPTQESINSILFGSAETLRNKSHDVARKNPWLSEGLNTWTAETIGTGITPNPKHPDPAKRAIAKELFARWTDESDAHGTVDFYGQQKVVARSVRRSGESLARFRDRLASDDLTVPLQIQLMPAAHLPFAKTERLSDGRTIRCGIEFDAIGRRAAYHLYREHPGDIFFGHGGELVRVPAADIMHVFEQLEEGQIRGVTALATVLMRARDFDLYENGELNRKRDASQFSGFIYEDPQLAAIAAEVGAEGDDILTKIMGALGGEGGGGVDLTRLEPNTFQKLRFGEKVEFAKPAEMGTGYSEFMRWVLRAMAMGQGLSYEMFTGDLTGVNYSSIRAGLIKVHRAMEQWQHTVFVFQFCRPTWNRFIDAAALNGRLGISATEYMKERHLWRMVDWRPQGWDWVDPVTEIKAIVMAIRAGLMTRSQAVAGYGYSAEDIDRELAADNERADGLGLVLDSDPRRVTTAGVGQFVDPDPSDVGRGQHSSDQQRRDEREQQQSRGAA